MICFGQWDLESDRNRGWDMGHMLERDEAEPASLGWFGARRCYCHGYGAGTVDKSCHSFTAHDVP
jgi:hypothetical protein